MIQTSAAPAALAATTESKPVLAAYKKRQGLTSPRWHFLTGSVDAVERVAHAIGGRFVDADKHIVHSLKIVVYTPSGAAEHVFDWDHRDVDAVLRAEGSVVE